VYSFPYTCQSRSSVAPDQNEDADIVVLNDEKDVILIIEIKKDSMSKKDKDQLISYSEKLLSISEERFMVLSMECTAFEFQFFCTFRFKGEIATVSLGDIDYFSFGSNSRGLLKLLYVLQLPWPFYGLMLFKSKNSDKPTLLKQKQLLGSGSSADVYEYIMGENSVVFKFFESNLHQEFENEERIYKLLKEKNVSDEMLWSDWTRCLLCMRSVRVPIDIQSLSVDIITNIYKFLYDFHVATNNVHRDIYYKNILISGNNVFLNDFAFAVPRGLKHEKKGNIYFSSDDILMDRNESFSYDFCHDIYSLTFTIIFLLYQKHFSEMFKETDNLSICNKRNQILNDLDKREIYLALWYAKKSDYDKARNHIIELLKNYFKA
jgi:serine/threonine protein kinase